MVNDATHSRPHARRQRPLGPSFFVRSPQTVARDLLGCMLVTDVDGRGAGGIIVEAEAYLGAHDPGSHAATRGITRRNSVMYGPPGTVYVYLSYGCHHMLNLVCCPEGTAGAVLVRAIAPMVGLDTMRLRRGAEVPIESLCSGPGRLSAALGVTLEDNGSHLGHGRVSVYDGDRVAPESVGISGRVGLTEGHELELRYYVLDNAFVSRGRIGPSPRARRRRS